ncbi:MAG: hypothetical protein HY794_07630 [Desulfarculus sp.]|nr:hypothetical protein [Desulfarculus sp.]
MGRHPKLNWRPWLALLLLAAGLAWPPAAAAQGPPPVLADLPSLAVAGDNCSPDCRSRETCGNGLVDVAKDESSFFGGSPLRTSADHAQDLGGVSDFLRREAPAPVWLVGTSMGTISAANAAGRLGPERVRGVVLSSTNLGGRHQAGVFALDLAAIRQPVLVAHHQEDDCFACPYHQVPRLLEDLTSAPVKEVLAYRGGLPAISDPCEALSAHGFHGLEDQVARDMGQWIKAHGPRP